MIINLLIIIKKERNLTKLMGPNWDSKSNQQTEISSWAKLATVR